MRPTRKTDEVIYREIRRLRNMAWISKDPARRMVRVRGPIAQAVSQSGSPPGEVNGDEAVQSLLVLQAQELTRT